VALVRKRTKRGASGPAERWQASPRSPGLRLHERGSTPVVVAGRPERIVAAFSTSGEPRFIVEGH
jgi:hypothetical protein